jgi:pyruvate dehydrogenase E2 component (dihydrolipoamide acetyltransferase)
MFPKSSPPCAKSVTFERIKSKERRLKRENKIKRLVEKLSPFAFLLPTCFFMATQVVMPKLSPTMEEGQLSRWLKNEGERVSVGEPIAEVDTDKATMEAQALASGVLLKILKPAGSTVPLGDVIAIIGEPDEDISALVSQADSGNAAAQNKEQIEEKVDAGGYGAQQEVAQVVPEAPRTQATIAGKPLAGDMSGSAKNIETQNAQAAQASAPSSGAAKTETANQTQTSGQQGDNGQRANGRTLISPIAARMASEAGINLQTLTGTGPGGRIIKRDIEAAISQKQTAATAQATAVPTAFQRTETAPPPPVETREQPASSRVQPAIETGATPFRDEPLTEMRKVIARRLTSSIGPVPHFFLTTEIEMDRALELRKQLNEIEPNLKVSVNDIIIKVVANALMQHPYVNASFQERAIRFYERADIGVAVALEEGLITPVVRAANVKSIGEISREVRDMAERARARKLKPEEYTGATFSISNLGMLGIDEFTAVINPPEAAILAVGGATPKPVVRDGEITVRNMMRVTMSCDHRVIDGATGAKFLQTVKRTLENPLSMLL